MGIGIKNQCLEDWGKMTPTEKGAFCSKCAKEVVNFSGLNSTETKLALKANINNRICGRFESNQLAELNKEFQQWERRLTKNTRSIFVFSLFLAFGLTLFSCDNQENLLEINQAQSIAKENFKSTEQPQSIERENHDTQPEPFINDLSLIDALVTDTIIEQNIQSDSVVQDQQEEEPIVHEVNLGRIEFPMDQPVHMVGLVVTVNRFDEFIEDTVDQSEIAKIESIAYPNPCINGTNLKITSNVEFDTEIQIFDLNGRILFDLPIQKISIGVTKIEIDLSSYPSGIYLIQHTTPEEKKVVKIRKV